ncbi:MAG: cation diffusion facilitator family transporter [Deltaproteobacteria bacterium]|nr:cation diffusion facilitator family transporter [Deltaproteobacteria bacterium]
MESDLRKIRTARLSLLGAASLTIAKFVVGILSGSLGVLSSAFDSLADIFMSGVNFLSIRKSMDPADATHPYGHGKVETLATAFEGAVIAGTGAWVIYEGIRRLIGRRIPASADLGIAMMAVGLVASWFISERIRKAGEETESPLLIADSLHFRTDVYTNGGILVSLVVFRFTGWAWLDPGVALLVGVYILVAAGKLLLPALYDLTDRGLPPEVVSRVEGIINAHRPMVVDFHDLRTRRAGSQKHVDFHVVVCREYPLKDAHRVADHLEMEVKQVLGNVDVVTHIDPCDIECPGIERCARVQGEIRKLDGPEERDGAVAETAKK